jgi:hypothetical protein
MVIADVKMLSGFIPFKPTVKKVNRDEMFGFSISTD